MDAVQSGDWDAVTDLIESAAAGKVDIVSVVKRCGAVVARRRGMDPRTLFGTSFTGSSGSPRRASARWNDAAPWNEGSTTPGTSPSRNTVHGFGTLSKRASYGTRDDRPWSHGLRGKTPASANEEGITAAANRPVDKSAERLHETHTISRQRKSSASVEPPKTRKSAAFFSMEDQLKLQEEQKGEKFHAGSLHHPAHHASLTNWRTGLRDRAPGGGSILLGSTITLIPPEGSPGSRSNSPRASSLGPRRSSKDVAPLPDEIMSRLMQPLKSKADLPPPERPAPKPIPFAPGGITSLKSLERGSHLLTNGRR